MSEWVLILLVLAAAGLSALLGSYVSLHPPTTPKRKHYFLAGFVMLAGATVVLSFVQQNRSSRDSRELREHIVALRHELGREINKVSADSELPRSQKKALPARTTTQPNPLKGALSTESAVTLREPPSVGPAKSEPAASAQVPNPTLTIHYPALGARDHYMVRSLSEQAGSLSARISVCLVDRKKQGDSDNRAADYCNDIYGPFVIELRNKLRNDGVIVVEYQDVVANIERGPSYKEAQFTAVFLDKLSQALGHVALSLRK